MAADRPVLLFCAPRAVGTTGVLPQPGAVWRSVGCCWFAQCQLAGGLRVAGSSAWWPGGMVRGHGGVGAAGHGGWQGAWCSGFLAEDILRRVHVRQPALGLTVLQWERSAHFWSCLLCLSVSITSMIGSHCWRREHWATESW